MPWTLTASTPFSLPAVIDSHGWAQLAPFAAHPEEDGFDYTLRLASSGRVVDCSVTAVEQGIQVDSPTSLTDEEAQELKNIATWMVGLKMDLRPFYAHARREPRLAHMEPGAKGRFLRSATIYEDLVKTILTTNTTWAGTKRMNAALVERYGRPGPGDRRAFPTPEQLAEVSPDELSATAKLGYRVPYVLELSRAVADSRLDLDYLKAPDLPTDAALKFLLGIKGVGNYAAATMLLLLGHYDFVPVDSIAVKSVGQMWHNGERVGSKEIYAAFESWQPYRGLAYWFWEWD